MPNIVSRNCAIGVLLLSIAALAGQFDGLDVVTKLVPGWTGMSISTVLCASLCAVAILQGERNGERYGGLIGRIVPTIATGISLYALVRHFAVPGFDEYLLRAQWGQMAPATALGLLFVSAGLLLPRGTRPGWVYSMLVIAASGMTLLGSTGYLLGAVALYEVSAFSAMSLPTVAVLALLSFAALFKRPDAGWIAMLFQNDSGGTLARWLMPFALTLPFLLSAITLVGSQRGMFDAAFGFGLLAVLLAITTTIAALAASSSLSASESARRKSEYLIQEIVNNSPALIYAKDTDGRFLLVNRTFCEFFDLDPASVLGKTDADLFGAEAAGRYRSVDQRVIAAGHSVTEEETVLQHGAVRSVLSVKAPLIDEGGDAYGICGISTDITDRKKMEEALAESERRANRIIAAAMDAVITIDEQGIIADWNPQAEHIFGWTRHEAVGVPVDELIIPELLRDSHRRGMARYLASRESKVLGRRLELTALKRDGRVFPVELSITTIRFGQKTGFSGFFRDISDRKLARERLQTQLERLALIDQITRATSQRFDLDSIFRIVVSAVEKRLPADFVCICHIDRESKEFVIGHLEAPNTKIRDGLGLHKGDVLEIAPELRERYSTGALIYEPDSIAATSPFDRLAETGLGSMVLAPIAIGKDGFGMLIAARSKKRSFCSSDCEFLKQLSEHVALAMQQAQLYGNLQKAYDELAQSQQAVLQQERLSAIGQMASGLAHDINNALSPMALYTQSLRENDADLPEKIRDYLQIVDRVTNDVSATVARMREYYRSDASEPELTRINLNELVSQVVELTRARWSDIPQRSGLVITVDTVLSSDLPALVGNASELRDAITNLVFNAIDAVDDGGTITIQTQHLTDAAGGPRVVLRVRDTGSGMDEETRKRCVEPFFTTKGAQGTGLGLGMVYGAAQRHHAQLDIDSAPGSGTTVSLEFPTTAAAAAVTPPDEQPHRFRPLRLLLVDDDPAVLESTAVVLNMEGHRITTADGGDSGIKALKAAHLAGEPFDGVITDLGMPYIDGHQVAKTVKELFPDTKVLLLTGWGSRMTGRDGTPSNVDIVLPKPAILEDLRAALRAF